MENKVVDIAIKKLDETLTEINETCPPPYVWLSANQRAAQILYDALNKIKLLK